MLIKKCYVAVTFVVICFITLHSHGNQGYSHDACQKDSLLFLDGFMNAVNFSPSIDKQVVFEYFSSASIGDSNDINRKVAYLENLKKSIYFVDEISTFSTDSMCSFLIKIPNPDPELSGFRKYVIDDTKKIVAYVTIVGFEEISTVSNLYTSDFEVRKVEHFMFPSFIWDCIAKTENIDLPLQEAVEICDKEEIEPELNVSAAKKVKN